MPHRKTKEGKRSIRKLIYRFSLNNTTSDSDVRSKATLYINLNKNVTTISNLVYQYLVAGNCKVSGKGLTGIGLITGASRSEAVVTKSHCGGIATGSIINADGDQVVSDVEVTAENYFKYIYGQEVDADTAATDLCGYISSISATPVDSTGAAIE